MILRGIRALELWQSVAALLALFGILHSCPAAASRPTPEFRAATAYRGFADVRHFAAAWYVTAPSWTRAGRMEVVTGIVAGSGSSRPFVSIGPVWRLNGTDRTFFAEFAFSPTVLAGSSIGARELGGNLHFTSSLALGTTFGKRRRQRIALRIQHLSNGGLHRVNPGLDLIGVSFVGSFGAP